MSFSNVEPKNVPKGLSEKILDKSTKYIEPELKSVFFKYSGVFLLSIFFSLFVCPQNGIGFLRSDFPLYHSLFHHNMLLCGLYCGFVFFVTTHLISFYFLTRFERIVIFKQLSYLPVSCMSLFFAFSMFPAFTEVNFSFLYGVGWVGVAIFACFFHKKLFLTRKVFRGV